MKVSLYCPKCKKEGKNKLLMYVGADVSGTLYPFCKVHRNVKVVLPTRKKESAKVPSGIK